VSERPHQAKVDSFVGGGEVADVVEQDAECSRETKKDSKRERGSDPVRHVIGGRPVGAFIASPHARENCRRFTGRESQDERRDADRDEYCDLHLEANSPPRAGDLGADPNHTASEPGAAQGLSMAGQFDTTTIDAVLLESAAEIRNR
jgi:hypothetical protein